tara:strand:+ start:201 stop:698 length:498 start_codon:yes stop_codon:yes gene_type:complete
MDYTQLKYFSITYKEMSEYYKADLFNLLNASFDLPSYELHQFTIINGFIKDNEIIGCVSLLHHNDLLEILNENENHEMTGYSKKGDNGLFVYNIAVRDNYKRKKIAEVLLNLCIRENLNVKYLHCQVEKNNEPSFNLFFKCGFQIEEEMINSDDSVVCVMSRNVQ